ncbi:MAG: redoxin family protein [Patescibacteria group bacterium]
MNNNNKKSTIITISVILAAVLALGYSLYKSSPQNQNPNTAGIDHHAGLSMTVNSDALNALVGKSMPDIQLSDKDGKVYTAADFKGKSTILFFNEGLMCYPACWNQIASFGSDERFNSDQIQAISIVVDPAKDWERAISQMPQLAKATTMFDSGANASRELGLLTLASSMHRGSLPGHTYIVLDKDAVVRYVLDDPNMAIANDMLFSKIGELK